MMAIEMPPGRIRNRHFFVSIPTSSQWIIWLLIFVGILFHSPFSLVSCDVTDPSSPSPPSSSSPYSPPSFSFPLFLERIDSLRSLILHFEQNNFINADGYQQIEGKMKEVKEVQWAYLQQTFENNKKNFIEKKKDEKDNNNNNNNNIQHDDHHHNHDSVPLSSSTSPISPTSVPSSSSPIVHPTPSQHTESESHPSVTSSSLSTSTIPPSSSPSPPSPPLPSVLSFSPPSPLCITEATLPSSRLHCIRQEFLHAYQGYERFAWGLDDFSPITRDGKASFGMMLTMIDSLDTIILMNYTAEYERIRSHVSTHLHFNDQEDINLFETTIRVLGGLLSAFALTHDDLWRDKAVELGNKLLISFNSPSGLPYGTMGFQSGKAYNPPWNQGASTVAEVGSIQLEFQYLSRITGDEKYRQKVDHITHSLYNMNISLYSQFVDVSTEKGRLLPGPITLGARVDSIYEYFIKQYIFNSPHLPSHQTIRDMTSHMYLLSLRDILNTLLKSSTPHQYFYFAEKIDNKYHGKMDHLVCFMPGMIILGLHSGIITNQQEWINQMKVAKEVMETCVQFYEQSPTGLAPEIIQFHVNGEGEGQGQGQRQEEKRKEEDLKSDAGMKNENDIPKMDQNDNSLSTHPPSPPSPSPPSSSFSPPDFLIDPLAAHSLLRPETIESLFYLYRFTHDDKYREYAWKIFQSLAKYCRIESGGYSGLLDVRRTDRDHRHDGVVWSNHNNHMESFFLSETMKYLYLIFSEDHLVPLHEWIFNTEAHPMPIDKMDYHAERKREREKIEEQGNGEMKQSEVNNSDGKKEHEEL